MNAPGNETLYRLLLIAGFMAILFGSSLLTRSIAWQPGSPDATGVDNQVVQVEADNLHVRGACTECGVVESTRIVALPGDVMETGTGKIPQKPVMGYEVTVRMEDGSNHLFLAENSTKWRPGERMMYIEGAGKPAP